MNAIESFIRAAAQKRGIDPDIAARVVRAEGGFDDPVRQSDVKVGGVREPSFGAFQLNMNGGLGSAALAAGIDPRISSNWQRAAEFALDHIAKNGWGDFHGAKAVGIGNFDGIGKGAAPKGITLNSTPASTPYAGYIPGGYPGAPGNAAPATPAAPAASSAGVDAAAAASVIPGSTPAAAATNPLSALLGKDGGLGSMAKAFGGEVNNPSASQIVPANLDTGGGSIAPQAAALMAALMADRRKKRGLTINSTPLDTSGIA